VIPALLAALALEAAPVTVEITTLRNSQGRVHVALCPRDKFLSEACAFEASAPASKGTTTLTFPAIPPGDYAAQAFHDENANHKMDRNFLGIPKEGFGFSRDAKIRFAPPKWDEAVITHEAKPQVLKFGMRYMLGGK
jgi:uncharacterized protein (DUF2141 family)